jgi:ATP-binding cassette subfamily A (ABC1) protein 5
MTPERILKGQWEPIEVMALPFQQTAQPEEFNLGIFSASTFMGMIFVLVPVSLAIDMVYDREVTIVNSKNSWTVKIKL